MAQFVGLDYTEKFLENGNQNVNPKGSHDHPSRPTVQEREEIIKDVNEELNSEAMEGVNEGIQKTKQLIGLRFQKSEDTKQLSQLKI